MFFTRKLAGKFTQGLPLFTIFSFVVSPTIAFCELDSSQDDFFETCGFEVHEQIGIGAYGTVWKAYRKRDRFLCALKLITKEGMSESDLQDVRNEVEIQRALSHSSILACIEYQETDEVICIALEYCAGGELFEGLLLEGPYSEKDACLKLRPVFEGIAYMHSQGYVHHDIHPANLCFKDEKQNNLKIIDFGLAFHESKPRVGEIAGTLDYIAPEILTGKNIGPKIDAFALGVILHIVLCGRLPFDKTNFDTWNHLRGRYKHLRMHKLNLSGKIWDNISDEAKDLVRGLLEPRLDRRLSVKEALQHPWVRGAFMEGEYLQVMSDLKSTSDTAKKEKLVNWLSSQGFIFSDSAKNIS